MTAFRLFPFWYRRPTIGRSILAEFVFLITGYYFNLKILPILSNLFRINKTVYFSKSLRIQNLYCFRFLRTFYIALSYIALQ